MVVQKAVKRYPLVKWLLLVSIVLVGVGLFQSRIVSDPDNAKTMVLLGYVAVAAILPFIGMAFPRRDVVTMELPTDHLAAMSKTELEGMLSTLDAAHAKGEMDGQRHARARERVLSAIKAKGKGAK